MKVSHYILILAFFSTLFTVFIHERNLDYLNGSYPAKNGMITTADEASYFQPAENYLEKGEWKDNSIGNSSYIQRPPGYGGLYLLAKMISNNDPFKVLKIIQVLLFFGSVLLFAAILKALHLSDKLVIFSSGIYALLPAFNGFVYYTLTESVTPFLMLLLVFAFMRTGKQLRWPDLLLLSLSIVLVTLIRPQLIIFPVGIVIVLFLRNRKYILLTISFLPLIFWLTRIHSIEGNWTLHPIYSNTNHSIYRPPHEAMTNLFRLWEYRSDKFHETIGLLITDTTDAQTELALKNTPSEFHSDIRPFLKKFQLISMYQRQQFETGLDRSLILQEDQFVNEINELTTNLTGEHIVLAYVVTPLRSAVEMFSKSHMNLAVYQTYWRGNWLVELMRYLCLIIISVSFALSIWYALRHWDEKIGIIALGILFTVLYLLFVQRLNEERYLTPLLPIAFITGLHGIWILKKGSHK